MKRLYKTVVDHEPPALRAILGERPSSTEATIRAVETRLGVPLPKTFKQFAAQVGAASWPVDIYGADALTPYPADYERPPFLIAFATDGGGNDWCFDTRKLQRNEYPIVFWDHEEPPSAEELAEPGHTTSFDAWLKDSLPDSIEDGVRDSLEERRNAIIAALEGHRETNIWPWSPSEDDVAGVEKDLGIALPRGYVWFTTTLGSTPWPFEIVDALELNRLTQEMRERFPETRSRWVAFGREADGSFVVFQKSGKPVSIGGPAIADASFYELLERRIAERSAQAAAPAAFALAEVPPGDLDAGAAGGDRITADVPRRIVDDERINSVWRAVAEAKKFAVSACPDGRVQVQIDEFNGGRRRMFLDAAAWATVERHLDELRATRR